MKFPTCVLIFLLSKILTQAQSVSGLIIDSNNHKVTEANIIVLQGDSTFYSRTVTDNQGNFNIKNLEVGSYILKISHVSYLTVFKNIKILQESDVNLGTVTLGNNIISEVKVVASRNFIDRKADMLVLNPNALGLTISNAFDILSYAPNITIKTGGSISLNGKDNVRVMLDGTLLNITGRDLISYLESLNKDLIARVELISNPSSKYDAAGSGGLINIVTKSYLQAGQSVNLKLNTSFSRYFNINPALSYSYSKNKISHLLTLNFDKGTTYEENHISNLSQQSSIESIINKQSFSSLISTNYNISDKFTLKSRIFFLKYSEKINQPTNTKDSVSSLVEQNSYNNSLVNPEFSLQAIFKASKNEILEFKYDFSNTAINRLVSYDATENFRNNSVYDYSRQLFFSNYKESFNINTIKLDYSLYKKITLEAGIKVSFVNNYNNFSYIDSINIPKDLKPFQRKFYYYENINSAYVLLSKVYNKLELKMGLRAENTRINILYNNYKIRDSSIINLFPTGFIFWHIDSTNSINLSYTKRISRPFYQDYNPSPNFISDYYRYYGNPYLRNQLSDQIEINFTTVKNYSISAFANFHNNLITDYIVQSPTNKQVIIQKININRAYQYGFILTLPIQFGNNRIVLNNYLYKKSSFNKTIDSSNSLNSINSFEIHLNYETKILNSIFRLNGYYVSSYLDGYFTNKPIYILNFSWKKDFNKNFSLGLSLNDPFKTYRIQSSNESNTFTSSQQFNTRQFRIMFTYKLNRGKNDNNSKLDEKTQERQRIK